MVPATSFFVLLCRHGIQNRLLPRNSSWLPSGEYAGSWGYRAKLEDRSSPLHLHLDDSPVNIVFHILIQVLIHTHIDK